MIYASGMKCLYKVGTGAFIQLQVTGISGSGYSNPLTDVRGKAPPLGVISANGGVTPGLMKLASLTFQCLAKADLSDYLTFKSRMANRGACVIKVELGPLNNYGGAGSGNLAVVDGVTCYVTELSQVQSSGELLTYSVTFQHSQ